MDAEEVVREFNGNTRSKNMRIAQSIYSFTLIDSRHVQKHPKER